MPGCRRARPCRARRVRAAARAAAALHDMQHAGCSTSAPSASSGHGQTWVQSSEVTFCDMAGGGCCSAGKPGQRADGSAARFAGAPPPTGAPPPYSRALALPCPAIPRRGPPPRPAHALPCSRAPRLGVGGPALSELSELALTWAGPSAEAGRSGCARGEIVGRCANSLAPTADAVAVVSREPARAGAVACCHPLVASQLPG